MLELNLEESRLYREIEAEGERKYKLKMVPKLLSEGFNLEKVAALLELSIEDVQQVVQPPDPTR